MRRATSRLRKGCETRRRPSRRSGAGRRPRTRWRRAGRRAAGVGRHAAVRPGRRQAPASASRPASSGSRTLGVSPSGRSDEQAPRRRRAGRRPGRAGGRAGRRARRGRPCASACGDQVDLQLGVVPQHGLPRLDRLLSPGGAQRRAAVRQQQQPPVRLAPRAGRARDRGTHSPSAAASAGSCAGARADGLQPDRRHRRRQSERRRPGIARAAAQARRPAPAPLGQLRDGPLQRRRPPGRVTPGGDAGGPRCSPGDARRRPRSRARAFSAGRRPAGPRPAARGSARRWPSGGRCPR